MKPRRPAVKDSVQKAFRDRHKESKQANVAAKAARPKTKAQAALADVWPFSPIEIRGEPLSATILQERRQ
jgi:predicted nucleic acid-binding protein